MLRLPLLSCSMSAASDVMTVPSGWAVQAQGPAGELPPDERGPARVVEVVPVHRGDLHRLTDRLPLEAASGPDADHRFAGVAPEPRRHRGGGLDLADAEVADLDVRTQVAGRLLERGDEEHRHLAATCTDRITTGS